ncbi:outer membrane beta-barrel protein [Oceanicoccus sagamiensis]|uniref:Uncharacterized protein n=1 Tax=Oceanicoccus sagamiensis TaxID=716816 RepID=A0A1X9NHU3_9GAMM|nr:outer membrane beta-barrel protein [Oceanicoccus sagamiensis]ARN75962.1 hypothetical protein BST96_18800 [Oceanicoccus sagamiensis]
MMFKNYTLLLALLAISHQAPAQDRFRLSLGSSVNDFNSEIRVDSKNLPAALPINLEKDLKFDDSVDIDWLAGYWRFSDKHRIQFEILPITRSARATLEDDIEFEDDIIKAGAFVKSDFDTTIYDINYMYSFYKTDKWELGATAGLYWMDVEVELEAAGDIQVRTRDGDGDISFQDDYKESEQAHAPLPLFGLSATYKILPNWEVGTGFRILDIEIGDYSGTFISFIASTNYFFSEHLGVGFSIGDFDLDVEADGSDYRGKFEWSYEGAQAYLSMRY